MSSTRSPCQIIIVVVVVIVFVVVVIKTIQQLAAAHQLDICFHCAAHTRQNICKTILRKKSFCVFWYF